MSRDISDRRSDVEYLSDQPVSLQMAAVSVVSDQPECRCRSSCSFRSFLISRYPRKSAIVVSYQQELLWFSKCRCISANVVYEQPVLFPISQKPFGSVSVVVHQPL